MLADQALRELRADDIGARASIYHALGDTYSRNGRWEDARQAYLKVLEYGRHYAGQMQAAHVFGALADLELRQGRLQVAAAYWRKGLDAVQSPANWGRLPLPVIDSDPSCRSLPIAFSAHPLRLRASAVKVYRISQ